MRQIIYIVILIFACLNNGTSQIDIQSELNVLTERNQLQKSDVQNWIITDNYISQASGVNNVYLRQTIDGIEVNKANYSLHFKNDKLLHSNNRFLANIDKYKIENTISLSASEALLRIADHLSYEITKEPETVSQQENSSRQTKIILEELSINEIPLKLAYQKIDQQLLLCWDMYFEEKRTGIWWNFRVSADTGEIIDTEKWTLSCSWDHDHDGQCKIENNAVAIPLAEQSMMMTGSYNVYPVPVESPNHGSREIISDPEDLIASPYGWHDTDGSSGAEYTITRGNNVLAQLDDDGNNGSGFRPEGGTELEFDFTLDLGLDPSEYDTAAITNLFYWNNVVHDIVYRHGFDEVSGNFQENNYGNGGDNDDAVNADAQDGSGTNNANFGTPPDGNKPRMQMYIWTQANPDRDSDLDNAIIIHEYGHGISNRLTGGPNNTSCLGNREQMGEGWSDWFAILLTIEEGDQGTDRRGLGTYVRNEPTDADGIRTYPYSTDMGINPHTYDDINGESVPHGLGSVWCAMLWEMTWDLIDVYGFDTDFYEGTGGNNIALDLVIEALKLQPCSPGFVDGRDAILLADRLLYNGDNQCLIWDAFARRGLGYSADQGDSDNRGDGVEAFDLPPSCSYTVELSANSPVSPGDNINYDILVRNETNSTINNIVVTNEVPDSTTYVMGSANNGGSESNGEVSWPSFNLSANQTTMLNFSVEVSENITDPYQFSDDLENGGGNWNAFSNNPSRSNWEIINGNGNLISGNHWFADDVNNHTDQYLTIIPAFVLKSDSELRFTHNYNTEVTWDGGQVHISTDGGNYWTDLGDKMTQNGYNSTINNNSSSPAFSGDSSGDLITIVDLADYEGECVLIRFWMHCDASVGDEGWYIDDIEISNTEFTVGNIVDVTSDEGDQTISLGTPTKIQSSVPVELIYFRGIAGQDANFLEWKTATEINTEKFEILKSENGNDQWSKISELKASGNSFDELIYQTEDLELFPDNYYKLRIKDIDGSISYSNIIYIKRDDLSFSTLNVYPNPTDDIIFIELISSNTSIIKWQMINGIGQLVGDGRFDGQRGSNKFELNIDHLEMGLYYLSIEQEGVRKLIKLFKQ